MRRYISALGVLMTLAPRAQAQVVDKPPAVSFGTEVVAASRYIWRGFDEGGFSMQPNTWIAFGGLRAASWFNVATIPTEHPRLTEQNLTVEYTHGFGAYEISGGWAGYFFPGGNGHSHETFVAIAHEGFGFLAPSVAVFHDFGLGRGTYVSAAVEHPLPPLVPSLDLASTFSIGYNHHHWTEGSGFSDANLGLKATWNANRHVSFSPFVNYSRSLNESMVPTRTYGGIEFAVR